MSDPLTASPLRPEQLSRLRSLIQEFSADQLLWVSGYLAGLTAGQQTHSGAAGIAAPEKVTVLYASQTGNAQKLAGLLHQRLVTTGCSVQLQDVADYKRSQLKSEKYLFLVASTHGEGDPPDLAVEFHQFLMGKKAPRLDGLRYSVLALGDSSYAQYCQVGRDMDARLAELGAVALVERVDCDVDYQDPADSWMDRITEALGEKISTRPSAIVAEAVPAPSVYSRKNPFQASVLENIVLNGRGSLKEVRHLELSLEGSGLIYQPGDAIGVLPQNSPELVNSLLEKLPYDAEERVEYASETGTLRDLLCHGVEISPISRPVVEAYNRYAQSVELGRLLHEENTRDLQAWLYGRDLLDLVTEYPVPGMDLTDFIATLRKLPARLYSIASGPTANPGEVHLTVATLRYRARARDRLGTASGWLARQEDGLIPVYLDENPNFRLPADLDRDIIMIGPGTGIAPFRAFLEERQEQGAGGRNWLFFGDQHFRTDFLYQREWQGHLKSGLLTRIDLAFSRDQEQKIYVQHRMLEQARGIYDWLEEGATFYVCGDANRMAPDVHEALLRIVARQGGMTPEGAREYLLELQREKRYLRDVY